MSYRDFLSEIKKGLLSPFYLLISSDPFLHTEAVSRIKELIPAEERDFNFHTYDLLSAEDRNVAFEEILDVLNTVPFFSARKFVVIENFQKLQKKDLEKLAFYLADPTDNSVLVLLHAGTVKKSMKEKLKAVKQIMLDIRESELPYWLKTKANAKGFQLTSTAMEYLLGTIGPDLGMLSSELDKCLLTGKETVEKKDIVEITEGKRTYNAFALVDAIKSKDTERAFTIYRILRETDEPYSLLGALNWQYGQVMSKTTSSKEKAYYADVFHALHKADLHIKSSGSFYPLELLLVKLVHLSKHHHSKKRRIS